MATHLKWLVSLWPNIRELIRPLAKKLAISRPAASRVRTESNLWLRQYAQSIAGDILSIGSGDDSDGEGGLYKNYFTCAERYTTSEFPDAGNCELRLDVRSMPEITDGRYDCVFCSGVLEHVDDFGSAVKEITRILRPGGHLLLGLPFRQALHYEPQDYWRFTEYGIRHLLSTDYTIVDLSPIDTRVDRFPAAYWVHAIKRGA